MSETSLAAADGEQETGIRVDLDAPDAGKAVTRERPRAPAAPKPKNWAEERANTSKEVKKRLAGIESRFQQQLADQEANHKRELAELRSRLDAVKPTREDSADSLDKDHEIAMEKLRGELEEAQERGDSKAVAKITTDISRAEGRYWAAKAAKQGVTDKTNERGGQTQQTQQGVQPRKVGGPTKASLAWAKANREWWNDTVDELAIDARQYAVHLNQRFTAEGGDPEDPEQFERIGKELRRRFPELAVKSAVRTRSQDPDEDPEFADDEDGAIDDNDDRGAHRNARRQAPPMVRDRGAPSRSQNTRTLTSADIKTMREVGMNPDNDKHVVQFLRSKVETEADEA